MKRGAMVATFMPRRLSSDASFVMAGTVEEKILSMHREKRDLAASFLEGADKVPAQITDELLLSLLG